MLLGAGTILSIDQVSCAVASGAKYIVSPGFDSKVVDHCIKYNIPIILGIATPTEIERALEFNLDVVEFFPAEALAGTAYLKAISAPYGVLEFLPTGGIEENDLLEYLQFMKVLACGGSWMVKSELIENTMV
jgi:2-dehydro-3-deoxyphosphogluconate aldolase/(4S)-4-hydroxy-2-oxoglutarate aldolase